MLSTRINRIFESRLRQRYKGLFLFNFDHYDQRPVIGYARAGLYLKAPRGTVLPRLARSGAGDSHRIRAQLPCGIFTTRPEDRVQERPVVPRRVVGRALAASAAYVVGNGPVSPHESLKYRFITVFHGGRIEVARGERESILGQGLPKIGERSERRLAQPRRVHRSREVHRLTREHRAVGQHECCFEDATRVEYAFGLDITEIDRMQLRFVV